MAIGVFEDEDMDRLHVIRLVLEDRLTWREAAERLRVGERQIGRLCARVRQEGHQGVLHKLKGRPSNRQLDEEVLSQALGAIHDPKWDGFGPTFARDKLGELYGISLGLETVRRWMVRTGAWINRRERPKHRSWRERRPCIGMLVQMDGSDHDWFEGRGPRCVLLVLIDDATGLLQYARFVDSEDTSNVMAAVKAYIEAFGRPVALYVDKDSIFRVNKQYEDEADRPATQFARAMGELGIEVIWAHSPQAKGRVERSFKTHQDRLVKELRLAGIATMEAANKFLAEVYVPRHNERYAVAPAEGIDAHRPLRAGHNLDEILSERETRVVGSDFTVRFESRWLQLLSGSALRVRPKDKVEVERRLDGSLHVRSKARYVPFKELAKPPYRPFYARRKPKDDWPTSSDVQGRAKSNKNKERWLWSWLRSRKRKDYHDNDTPASTAEAFI